MSEQKQVYNTDDTTLCDFCLTDITQAVHVRENEVFTFLLCSICSSIWDQHTKEENQNA